MSSKSRRNEASCLWLSVCLFQVISPRFPRHNMLFIETLPQAQARVQAGGTGTAENPLHFRSPGPVSSNSFAALPTGGIIGQLSAHGMQTSLSQGIGIGRGGSGGVGIRGITSVAPPSGYRGRGSYAGSLPRRQRHKVSSKDLTEEQRNERRWVWVVSNASLSVSAYLLWCPFCLGGCTQ